MERVEPKSDKMETVRKAPKPPAEKNRNLPSPPSLRTRSARRRDALKPPHLQPELARLLIRHAALNHGDDAYATCAAVCRAWRDAAAQVRHLVPHAAYGDLKAGRRFKRFDRPHAALVLDDGKLVIGDCDNFRLQFWTTNGVYIDEVNLEGGTACPTGLATDGSHLFVVEHGSHQVSKLRIDTYTLSCRAGQWGGGDGDLRHPWGICFASGKLFVVDGGNGRVSVYSSRLEYCFSFGGHGSGKSELLDPKGCAAYKGEIYVADTGNHRLQVYSQKGLWRRSIGGEGSAPGLFIAPTGVAVANNRVYVTETTGARLQVLDLKGAPQQIVRLDVPLSGVFADSQKVCVTALEPELSSLDANMNRKLPNAVHIFDVTSSSPLMVD